MRFRFSSKGIVLRTGLLASALGCALGAPGGARAAAVFWNVDADGFWDIAANWTPRLPTAQDDITIDVGGLAVRTVTFRFGSETVGSLGSFENLHVTGGRLVVLGVYRNTQTTRISGIGLGIGGTLWLQGESTIARLHIETGGTLTGPGIVNAFSASRWTGGTLTGPGIVNAFSASRRTGGTQPGFGETRHLAPPVPRIERLRADTDGGSRLVEFRGGVTTGSFYVIRTGATFGGTGGLLRNAAGSLFLDTGGGSIIPVDARAPAGSFENGGTFRKAGGGVTAIGVPFTSTGLLDIEAGTFHLFGGSAPGGEVRLGPAAVRDFGNGAHAIGPRVLAASPSALIRMEPLTRDSAISVTIAGPAALPNLEIRGGRLDVPDPGTSILGTSVVTAGDAVFTFGGTGPLFLNRPDQSSGGTFAFDTPVSTKRFDGFGTITGSGALTVVGEADWGGTQLGSGQTLFAGPTRLGSAGPLLIGDTRVVAFADTVETGNRLVIRTGFTPSGTGGTLRILEGATFLDQTVGPEFEGGLSISVARAFHPRGSFENLGTFRKVGASVSIIDVNFGSSGLLDLGAGTLRLQRTSTIGGDVRIAPGATLQFFDGSHTRSDVAFTGGPGGSVDVTRGFVTINGAVTLPNVRLEDARLTMNGSGWSMAAFDIVGERRAEALLNGRGTIGSFVQTGFGRNSDLAGIGEVVITSSAFWAGGAQRSPGATIFAGPAQLGSADRPLLFLGRLVEFRDVVDTAPRLELDTAVGGRLRIADGAVFRGSTSVSLILGSPFGGSIENAGTFLKTGSGTSEIRSVFTNTGVVRVDEGVLQIRSRLTNASTTALEEGTWIASGPGAILFGPETGIDRLERSRADITLAGPGSRIEAGRFETQPIEDTLAASFGALRILDGRRYAVRGGFGTFDNHGLLQLGGGTFAAAELRNWGTIAGTGTIDAPIVDLGSEVRPEGGILRTREITGGGHLVTGGGEMLDMTAAAGRLVGAARHPVRRGPSCHRRAGSRHRRGLSQRRLRRGRCL